MINGWHLFWIYFMLSGLYLVYILNDLDDLDAKVLRLESKPVPLTEKELYKLKKYKKVQEVLATLPDELKYINNLFDIFKIIALFFGWYILPYGMIAALVTLGEDD